MIKRFLGWIKLKQRLHTISAQPPLVRERDLWWLSLGENVGSEMNGKSRLFSRPALILKKLAHGFFLIAPTTTKNHNGTWYVKITYADKDMWVCLHQIRTIDYRRLSSQLGQVGVDDFRQAQTAFWELYK
jgi:mRNA interferase MazF